MKLIPWLGLLLLLVGCGPANPISKQMEKPKSTEERLNELANKSVAYLEHVPVQAAGFPRAGTPEGAVEKTTSRSWTSGFYPGMLWQLYRHSKDERLLAAARQWTSLEEKEKHDTHTHDLGFKIFCSFGEGLEVEPSEPYRQVIVEASETLIKRYNPTVGAIRSWDFNADVWEFPVIIDNMMNLEMLFAATRISGDSSFAKVARQHALTTLEHHFRPNYSSYHVIDYDTLTGEVRNRHTHQGKAHESAWARGQAWALYGFAMCYEETGEPVFLEQARNIAEFFFNHPNLPADNIPFWDFDATGPDAPRDVSAATIAASALLALYNSDPGQRDKYLAWVDPIMDSLLLPEYQSDVAPFLLDHSTGSKPGNSEVDVPIIYADYYYIEALLRLKDIEQTLTR
ncbi:glucuronyl hydrolase [Neolewinella aurantiaca]|uniref:Glucuronyl hydrolase n=1 Tax=Neolewinella aurantiaca TaxID=2602767 RepID=A0A5C7FKB5_9BACT|nr:glycoside hydrolase family 88 protein [Neolewinella aurantiaca]TXF91769.1 glucuronyl hydrolase [Neolewinella aurantiaca]